MNHLKFQDPMILKFERSEVHPSATPQPQCAAQKQDGATDAPAYLVVADGALVDPEVMQVYKWSGAWHLSPEPNAAAQSPATERPGESSALTTTDAAAPLKPGDLIMVEVEEDFGNWRRAYFSSYGTADQILFVKVAVEGSGVLSDRTNWRLPTSAELAEENPWISWAGGECPVPGKKIALRYRSGREVISSMPGEDGPWWHHEPAWNGDRNDIIAYRVLA